MTLTRGTVVKMAATQDTESIPLAKHETRPTYTEHRTHTNPERVTPPSADRSLP